MATSSYQFLKGDSFQFTNGDSHLFTQGEGRMYEARLLVDGKPCPGRLGLLRGCFGHWEAEWVDGSRVGSFRTRLEAAKALENFCFYG